MEEWLHPLLRALHYALLLGLFGLTALPAWGLRGVELPRFSNMVCGAAWFAPVISAALMAVGVAAMMGQPVAALEWPVVESMLVSTSIGWAFGVRLVLLIAAALLQVRRPGASPILYGLALTTLPWSGHAAAGEGGLGLIHRLNDGVHLLAAGLWIGAIGWFAWLAFRAHRGEGEVAPLLTAMHRFAPYGIGLVAIVTVTGLINAQLIFGLEDSLAVLTTAYGGLLAAKIGLIVLMLLCANRHAAIARKAVFADPEFADRPVALKAARTSLATELALAAAVLGVVAVMGLLSPSM